MSSVRKHPYVLRVTFLKAQRMLGIQCTELILYIWLQEKTVCVQRGTLTVVSIAQMISSPQKWLVQHRFPSLQDTKQIESKSGRL